MGREGAEKEIRGRRGVGEGWNNIRYLPSRIRIGKYREYILGPILLSIIYSCTASQSFRCVCMYLCSAGRYRHHYINSIFSYTCRYPIKRSAMRYVQNVAQKSEMQNENISPMSKIKKKLSGLQFSIPI
jgi:hypothetical protein